MSITDELHRLGNSARRLNAGSDSLNEAIQQIDKLLGRLNVGLDYVHPRPLAETTRVDHSGKRVIDLVYVAYLKVDRSYHLAIRTTKVLESRLQLATQTPGKDVKLLNAPRPVRFAAVDMLPEVVEGLATQVDEMVAAMERRQKTADSLLRNLEAIAGDGGRLTRMPEVTAAASQSQHSQATHASASSSAHNMIPGDPGASSSSSMVASPAAYESTSAPVEPAPRTEFYPGTGHKTEPTPVVPPDDSPRKTVPIGSNALSRLQSDRR